MAPLGAPPFNFSIVWVTVTIQVISKKKVIICLIVNRCILCVQTTKGCSIFGTSEYYVHIFLQTTKGCSIFGTLGHCISLNP